MKEMYHSPFFVSTRVNLSCPLYLGTLLRTIYSFIYVVEMLYCLVIVIVVLSCYTCGGGMHLKWSFNFVEVCVLKIAAMTIWVGSMSAIWW